MKGKRWEETRRDGKKWRDTKGRTNQFDERSIVAFKRMITFVCLSPVANFSKPNPLRFAPTFRQRVFLSVANGVSTCRLHRSPLSFFLNAPHLSLLSFLPQHPIATYVRSSSSLHSNSAHIPSHFLPNLSHSLPPSSNSSLILHPSPPLQSCDSTSYRFYSYRNISSLHSPHHPILPPCPLRHSSTIPSPPSATNADETTNPRRNTRHRIQNLHSQPSSFQCGCPLAARHPRPRCCCRRV